MTESESGVLPLHYTSIFICLLSCLSTTIFIIYYFQKKSTLFSKFFKYFLKYFLIQSKNRLIILFIKYYCLFHIFMLYYKEVLGLYADFVISRNQQNILHYHNTGSVKLKFMSETLLIWNNWGHDAVFKLTEQAPITFVIRCLFFFLGKFTLENLQIIWYYCNI